MYVAELLSEILGSDDVKWRSLARDNETIEEAITISITILRAAAFAFAPACRYYGRWLSIYVAKYQS